MENEGRGRGGIDGNCMAFVNAKYAWVSRTHVCITFFVVVVGTTANRLWRALMHK